MKMGEAWREWWETHHGWKNKTKPIGGVYDRTEGITYDAFTAGWEAHAKLSTVPSTASDVQSPDREGGHVPLEV